jgi:hypothetical protein
MAPRRIRHPAVAPIAERDEWSKRLRKLATTPLEFCEDFPTIAKRYETWWNQGVLDRPLFAASVPAEARRETSKHLELLGSPEEWFEATLADLKAIRWIGDALPNIRVDFGPVMLGGLLGAETEFGSDTTWTHAFIDDDWSNAPDWSIREDTPFWKLLVRLMRMVSRDAAGRYLVRTPDLGGSADVLLNLRGSGPLCIDVLEKPDVVGEAADAIYPSWRRGFTECYRVALSEGAGLIHWIGLWSDEPYMIPACDFNYLIGPEPFERIFLPDIARQAATAGRAVFHLDGPGATRHIDALLDIPEMKAVQYVPGAGTPSALPWIEMLRKIQSTGRSLVVCCPPTEVLRLTELLRPEGLAFTPSGGGGWDRIDDIFAALRKRFGCKR